MAKQAEDTVTAELPLPDAPRRRGRPSTGTAMTAAERKREQRSRARLALRDAVARPAVLEEVPLSALLEDLGRAVSLGSVLTAADLTRELNRRALANRARRS